MSAARHPVSSDLSPDELQAAWAEVRDSDWPTLTELQRHLARYHQVRAAALRRRQGVIAPVLEPATPRHVPKPGPWPPAPEQARPIDRKSLAAGERDDD